MKRFFKITSPRYVFEWNDLRCVITMLNVALIMLFGLKIAWFGLAVALAGMVKELTGNRHINNLLMYCANIILNSYFISLL